MGNGPSRARERLEGGPNALYELFFDFKALASAGRTPLQAFEGGKGEGPASAKTSKFFRQRSTTAHVPCLTLEQA